MLESLKAHPFMVAGGIIGVVVLLVIMRGGGGDSGGAAVDQSAVNAGMQLTAQQNALAAHASDTMAALQASQDINSRDLAIAKLSSDLNYHVADLAASVQFAEINAAQSTTNLTSTLNAQTSQKNIQADVDKTSLTTGASVENNRIMAGALTSIAASNAAVAQANITAATQIATSCHGLGCLF